MRITTSCRTSNPTPTRAKGHIGCSICAAACAPCSPQVPIQVSQAFSAFNFISDHLLTTVAYADIPDAFTEAELSVYQAIHMNWQTMVSCGSALHAAVHSNDFELAELLVKYKANVNFQSLEVVPLFCISKTTTRRWMDDEDEGRRRWMMKMKEEEHG